MSSASLSTSRKIKRLLFDWESGENTLYNAHKLGIDLSNLDSVVLSHSHYDHSAGYKDLTEAGLGSEDLYVGKGFFQKKYTFDGIKLSMGASTVAMITTASITVSLMETMGFASSLGRVLVVMAIGSGSMVASHTNDSYFRVVSQFSDMKTEDAYKAQTGMTGAFFFPDS